MTKRGRPKGQSFDTRSFGPLGDLIRRHRLAKQFGLAEVADACGCSVQFISNIEHGRAPLPWDKVPALSKFLGIPQGDLQAACLAVRSDFRSFISVTRRQGATAGSSKSRAQALPMAASSGTAIAIAGAAMAAATGSSRRLAPRPNVLAPAGKPVDPRLNELLAAYQAATPASRRRFVKAALKLLAH